MFHSFARIAGTIAVRGRRLLANYASLSPGKLPSVIFAKLCSVEIYCMILLEWGSYETKFCEDAWNNSVLLLIIFVSWQINLGHFCKTMLCRNLLYDFIRVK